METQTALTPTAPQGAMIEVAQSRVAQEVQASMVMARKCPRDQNAAYARIIEACKRRSLAAQATYAYPRGGSTVTGPSIRLAEVLAQSWGNLDFGIVEIEQRAGESTVMAYAWDLETNVRQVKIFSVPHARFTKKAGLVSLQDPRDIYEMTANQGARRLRACILGVIPGDIVEAATDQCTRTLTEGHTEPLADRVRQMTAAFSALGVSVEMIEKRLGHRLKVTNEQELVQLHAVYRSIKDNMQSTHDFFDMGDDDKKSTTDRVKDAVKKKTGAKRNEGNGKSGSSRDEEENRGEDYISVKQNRLLWFEAGKMAEAVYQDKKEAAGIIDALLSEHGIEADPEDEHGRPTSMMIPWKKFNDILAAVKAWGGDQAEAEATASGEELDF